MSSSDDIFYCRTFSECCGGEEYLDYARDCSDQRQGGHEGLLPLYGRLSGRWLAVIGGWLVIGSRCRRGHLSRVTANAQYSQQSISFVDGVGRLMGTSHETPVRGISAGKAPARLDAAKCGHGAQLVVRPGQQGQYP